MKTLFEGIEKGCIGKKWVKASGNRYLSLKAYSVISATTSKVKFVSLSTKDILEGVTALKSLLRKNTIEGDLIVFKTIPTESAARRDTLNRGTNIQQADSIYRNVGSECKTVGRFYIIKFRNYLLP